MLKEVAGLFDFMGPLFFIHFFWRLGGQKGLRNVCFARKTLVPGVYCTLHWKEDKKTACLSKKKLMSTQKKRGDMRGAWVGGFFFYFLNTWLASTSNWETASRSHLQAAETIHSMETSSGVEADQGESHLNCQAPLQLSHGTPSLACPENVWNQILISLVVPGIFWSKQWVYLTWKYIEFSLHLAILWIN